MSTEPEVKIALDETGYPIGVDGDKADRLNPGNPTMDSDEAEEPSGGSW